MAPKRLKMCLARRSTADRKEQRALVGRLKDVLVQPRTRRRYEVAMDRFLLFLKQNGDTYPATFVELDDRLSEYVECLWENGDPKGWAGDALSSVIFHVPACRPFLAGGWRLHAAWSRRELPSRAPPFTPLILHGLCGYCRDQGWGDTVLLLMLGWHTYARSGELFGATAGDFVIGRRGTGVWRLPLSKSGQRNGDQECLTITDEFVGRRVAAIISTKSAGSPLSDNSAVVHRCRLRDACQALGLTHGFRWYSVRRGGATEGYRRSGDLAAIMLRGRWSATKTARIYLTDGLAHLADLCLTPAQERRLRELALSVRQSFDAAT